MRSRTGSGVRLDRILFMVDQTICKYQNAITGLFANQKDFPGHAWIRDNVYVIHSLWALYRAYMKCAEFDEDLTKANELGLTCIKMMQSLLECMMRQADKVEMFKKYQRPVDALHSKFSVSTKSTVCGDTEWGHLQIDAISLFLLTLAQITASGLQVVRNFDEVAFIQNLVYYIETGYRTPDFGIWERGDKTNQGIRELNASSIGMVKAALQALNDVGDLFGDGSRRSAIHVLPDEIEQCSAVLSSMLPRESFSKETDAALLTIISYPGFAVEDAELVEQTRDTITTKLLGKYGCRRFLRDGYKTALEDPYRLYYNKSELQQFENIECEWPLFLCLLMLDAMYNKNDEAVEDYWQRLESVVVLCEKGFRLIPELYKVERHCVAAEKANRGSQPRIPAGATPYLWAQSLYVICCLLYEGFLSPAELDPLSRRLSSHEKRPPCEVQVTILAKTGEVQRELRANGINVQRIDEIDPVFTILPASSLAEFHSRIGQSKKLRLSGRPSDRDIGLLSTSRLYQIGQKFVIFTPQFMDSRRSHLMYDIRILMDEWSSELQYIYASWNSVSISGRPLVVLVINSDMLTTDGLSNFSNISLNRFMKSTVIGTIKKINTGYLGGARIVMRNLSDFFRTTAVSKLEFNDNSGEFLLDEPETKIQFALPSDVSLADRTSFSLSPKPSSIRRGESVRDRSTYNLVHKVSMRHRSIALDSNDSDLVKLRLKYAPRDPPEIQTYGPPTAPVAMSETNASISRNMLKTTTRNADSTRKDYSQQQMNTMKADDLVELLLETTVLEEQASIVHCLWMNQGPDYEFELNEQYVTIKMLMEEVYTKSCECRLWALVRLTAGLLGKRLEELGKAVTHLLVRQKQITVGLPSKKEEAITSPKTNEELKEIMHRAYSDDPNAFTLSQEIIVALGSLVRTEPKLFVEMFRLRIGLIIQVLASELARIRKLSAADAAENLMTISPFELKSMLFSLLSGRLLEEFVDDCDAAKETRTGIGSFRRHIEERKSLRKSTRSIPERTIQEVEEEEDEELAEDDFQFGIWLRHRRIDGALNRVPNNFYATLWDTVNRLPHGVRINDTILHWGLTQEMTRREMKFALEVEQVLNRIAEPEYREMVVEVLWLLGRLDRLVQSDQPNIPRDRPLDIDVLLRKANELFVKHNREMGTIVLECCASGKRCDGARGLCRHLYDSAPAGEFGTSHYIIKAMMILFT
ncbi:hypothetical protein V3C99_000306 [Haemonchus contortus]|uniref:Phosphorylase b kinase regulatory subunit n=1 Tax=Haemonchus contortus TaxID=6289 RepID=A0A7I4YFN4_HAECO